MKSRGGVRVTIVAGTGETLGEADLEPICGDLFCEYCGRCLHCGATGCVGGRESCWCVVYEDQLLAAMAESSRERGPPPTRPD